MKLIPTKVHGVLDYLSAATLFVLPDLLGWDKELTKRVKLAAVGTALYSLVTRYEWGWEPVKLLPMGAHLGMDGTSGALFCAGPLLIPGEDQAAKNWLVGIGIFELLVTLNSQSQPREGV